MMTTTFRRNTVLAITLIAICLMLILLDRSDRLDGPKSLVAGIVTPIGRAFTGIGNSVSGLRQGGDADLRRELEAVTAERDALLKENIELRGMAAEMEQLRAQLRFQQERPELTLLTADVIARDPQSREKYLIINRGSNDGVMVGMAVVSPNYFVGQITEVEPNRSKVLLVIDSQFQTGAKLALAGAEGIVYGRWQSGERIILKHIPANTQVEAGENGDLAVTSGKTARVPANLIIGKVVAAVRDDLRNEIQAEIVPIVDFDELQAVTIILGYPEQ
jgi:rod shape-determining protein MreC